jgi:membrane-bound lytic murein transglycosylase B
MSSFGLNRRALFAAPLLVAPWYIPDTAAAAVPEFQSFLAGLRRDALARGIRPGTVAAAFSAIEYLPHVIELDRHQPEHVMTFDEYLAKVVTPEREAHARERLAENRTLLAGIERRFAVDRELIVALWGVESDFGQNLGNYEVASALATLAFEGRRRSYFRPELLAALRIIDGGNIGVRQMTGSWAGAMGQCQFMPTTYLGYAVDYDGDGRRDIWFDRADVLASIANFISRLGWRQGERWGQEVVLPAGFDASGSGLGTWRSTAEWSRLGIRSADGTPLAGQASEASLVLPGGAEGPALLVRHNFRTIMRWNNSTYFAAAVGYLADSMRQG